MTASLTEQRVAWLESNIRTLLKATGQQGTCKGCGATIYWLSLRSGKTAPYTLEALNHFADCPKANDFRPTQREIVEGPKVDPEQVAKEYEDFYRRPKAERQQAYFE